MKAGSWTGCRGRARPDAFGLARGVVHDGRGCSAAGRPALRARNRRRAGHVRHQHPAVAVGHAVASGRRCGGTRRPCRLSCSMLSKLSPLEAMSTVQRVMWPSAASGSNGRAVHVGEEGEHVVLRHRHVEVDLRAVVEGVHHVRGEAVGALEPADVLAVAAARQDAEIDRHGGVEAEVRHPLLQPFPVGDDRHDVEDGIVFGHAEVVHHAVVGNSNHASRFIFAVRADLVIGAGRGSAGPWPHSRRRPCRRSRGRSWGGR